MKRSVTALAVSALALGGLGVAAAGQPASAAPMQFVANGGFEAGTATWRSDADVQAVEYSETRQKVGVLTAKRVRHGRVQVGRSVLTDAGTTVPSAVKGASYTASALVKTNRPPLDVSLVVVETDGRNVLRHMQDALIRDDGWHRLQVTFETTLDDPSLDVRIRTRLDRGQRVLVDDVSLVGIPGTETDTGADPVVDPVDPTPTQEPTPTPTTTTTPTPTPTPTATPTPVDTRKALSNGCRYNARGIFDDCATVVGAAYGGNADPAPWEAEMGAHLGVRRTYYRYDQIDSAVNRSATDLAAGRIPWISFKLPYSWAEMASGKGDAWARTLGQKLATLKGPVWVALHHEPETDGPIADWTAMQERLAPIIRAEAPNAAFTIVVTGWHQRYGESQYSLANIWPDTKIDMVGFDIYDKYGMPHNDGYFTEHTDMLNQYFKPFSAFASSKGAAWGIAETGVTLASVNHDPTWMKRTVADMRATGGIAFTYFNTPLNSVADWTLESPVKASLFTNLLKSAPTL
jgi:hypothetical protein